jgi:hypothetical protein
LVCIITDWSFDEDGGSIEGHYHASTIEPLLWSTELLQRQGIDLYDRRLGTILRSRSAEAAGYPYRGPIVGFVDAQRFPKELVAELTKPCDGLHLYAGLTVLRWQGLEVGMNSGKQLSRGCPGRCALRVAVKTKDHSPTYFTGTTDGPWTEGNGRLTMLGEKGTEVLTFRVPGT